MAIHPTLRRSQAVAASSQNALSPQQTRDVSAWTEQAAAALHDLNISGSGPGLNSERDNDVPISATGPDSTAVNISALQTASGESVSLAIPLADEHAGGDSVTSRSGHSPGDANAGVRPTVSTSVSGSQARPPKVSVSFRRRENVPSGRDSMRRREELAKGKDGSRRRQRWENGMLNIL